MLKMNKEEIKKKGKEFWEKNKFKIGYVAGCAWIFGGMCVVGKILETKKIGIQFGYFDDVNGTYDVGVHIYGYDRFGKRTKLFDAGYDLEGATTVRDSCDKCIELRKKVLNKE